MAVLQGDPSKSEPFTVRLRLPNGYKIPPHTHPTAENVTVLTGTFLAGSGTQFDESQLEEIGRDGFLSIPAEHAHYAMARGLTVVQVHAIGPFALTYVNAADNPVTRVARWSPDQQPIGAAHQFP
jgi:quercetin dioxygenase-like cupin family protein